MKIIQRSAGGMNPSFGFWATQLAREMSEEFSKKLARQKMKMMDWAVLATLYRNEASRPAEIARQTCIEPSVITRVLNRLEKQKLLTRKHQGDDRRAVEIALTAKGRKTTKLLFELSMETNETFLAPLPESERGKVIETLGRIVTVWRAAKKAKAS